MALYPPIVASSMPAFDVSKGQVRIYFNLSNLNSNTINDVAEIHYTLRYQNSNRNVLKFASQIGITSAQFDQIKNQYYITIKNEDLKEKFVQNRLYKVQLRFSSKNKGNQSQAEFFTNDINSFSEWSTVCIIKPVIAPIFYILEFDPNGEGKDSEDTDTNYFYSEFSDFVMTYKQNDSSEILRSWRIRLLNSSFSKENDLQNIQQYTLADSGQIFVSANNYNLNSNNLVLQGSLPYILQQSSPGPDYKVYIEIFTKNDFTKGVLYSFTYSPQVVDEIQGTLNTYVNEEEGYIKLDFSSQQANYNKNLAIRRTDSKSNFSKWEDLKNFVWTNNQGINFSYYDFTAQSGIIYKYLVQKRDERGRRGKPVYDQSSNSATGGLIAEWQHAFLLESNGKDLKGVKQLKLKYDFQISSYKTNISESKTDTIGSKYPYIRRNGNMYYRSFPITGTITAYMDQADLFISDKEIYNSQTEKYKNYKGQIGQYTTVYDYTRERLFREKVEEFLYNAKPKLYKSMQEGNIFIKLMEISLTPKNELGRLIYTFSATAYEIDEACIDTYNKNGLINIGQYNSNIVTTKTIMSRLGNYNGDDQSTGIVFEGGKDIIGTDSTSAATSINLADKIQYQQSVNGQIVNNFTMDWLRLEMESDPYLIIRDGNSYSVLEESTSKPIDYPLYQLESTYNNKQDDIYLGWLFTINGQQIIISPPNNIYQLKDNDFKFNGKTLSIIPAKETTMNVDYRTTVTMVTDQAKIRKNVRIEPINGQLSGKFYNGDQIVNQLRLKYKYSYQNNNGKQKRYLKGIKSILIDTQPRVVIKVKTNLIGSSTIPDEERFVVNETGELNFDPSNSDITIESFKIIGQNFVWIENNIQNGNRVSITLPLEGYVCQQGNKYYYYHNHTWYECKLITENSYNTWDVYCPIEALIFYYINIQEDTY